MIGFGYAATWRGWFTAQGADTLMTFTQSFAIPCLLFAAIARLDLAANFDPGLLAAYFSAITVCFFVGMFGARYLFGRPWPDAVVFGFVCLFANSVLMGLPITERAYGTEALSPNYAIIALHAPWCYSLGIIAMEIVRADKGQTVAAVAGTVAKAVFKNALLIGIALGFVVNLGDIPLPGVVWAGVDLMVQAALPAALFGLGGILFQYRPEGDMRAILFCVAICLLLRPVLISGTVTLAGLDLGQIRSAVLNGAMPAGVNVYVFANMYGAAKRVAASTVLIGTALSILTLSAWLVALP